MIIFCLGSVQEIEEHACTRSHAALRLFRKARRSGAIQDEASVVV